MTRIAVAVMAALAVAGAPAGEAAAQDSSAVVRDPLPLDTARVRREQRVYEMVVYRADSLVAIGERIVSVDYAAYAGVVGWVVVETRTGAVPSTDSLYLTPGLRPMRWVSRLGAARLALEFTVDSIYGAAAAPPGRHNIVMGNRSDLVASQAMLELALPLLPLAPAWTDSAAVLAIDLAAARVHPLAITVVGAEPVSTDSGSLRHAWVVAARSPAAGTLVWIDRDTGEVHRVQTTLPAHAGLLLEYRRRPAAPGVP